MRSRARGVFAGLVVLSIFSAGPLDAQGTREDYDRSAHLHERFDHVIGGGKVEPHWSADESHFWYRLELPNRRTRYVLVDAVAGRRREAFDHTRLAQSLSRLLHRSINGDDLPLEDLNFDQTNSFALSVNGAWYRCDTRTYAVAPDPQKETSAPSLAATTDLSGTSRTGTDTVIHFLNHTAAAVEVFWLDLNARRQHYATIGPGDRYDQHTYEGHRWVVTDAGGKLLAAFEAPGTPANAVIDGSPVPPPPAPSNASSADSPDGRWTVVIQNDNVHLRSRHGNPVDQTLTTDGAPDDRYTGECFWSPDSHKLVAIRTRPPQEHELYRVESSPRDQLQPKVHISQYLKPGDRIAVSRPHLFDIGNRKEIPVSDALFPTPWSIDDVRWSPDSSRFTFLYNQRGHQVLRIVAVDAKTGDARAIVDEHSKTFIDYAGRHYNHYLDATGEIIWMSERDGWSHLYLYDADTGRVKNQITRGNWLVRAVDDVDEKRRQIYFRAGGIRPGQDPYYVHYCRVDFDGSHLTILTEGDATHSVAYSPGRRFLVDTYSRVDQPPTVELRSGRDGSLICPLEKADGHKLREAGWQPPEPFVAKARDGVTDIYGVLFRPTHFDPHAHYPVIEDIYAGPQGSFVPKDYEPVREPQELAELGFIVVQVDGMGTSNRSKAFHDVCWKNLGDAGLPDRILWMKAAAQKYPYLDLTRVGIYGTSAGGQNALGALLFHGDFYKAGVADCGCHDNRMDKIWWNELWMGWPIGPEYEEQSNVTHARELKGKLLLMVGELDDNVDPSSTMQVVNALIKADKDFDLLVVPGNGHGVRGTPYGRRRLQDFFVRNLLGREPRAG